jgi:superfamily II DNA/RNA helicase
MHVHANNHHTTTAQDPAFFIHRVGRAARAGRRGQSLTLLSPEEDAYIEFLALRRVPLTEVPHSWDFAAAASTASTSSTTTADAATTDVDTADAAASADFELEAESEAESDTEGDDVSDDVSMSDSPELPQGGADVSAMSAEDAAVAEQDEAVLQRARQLVRTDRDLLEKGTRAFVAFVRAYKVSLLHLVL